MTLQGHQVCLALIGPNIKPNLSGYHLKIEPLWTKLPPLPLNAPYMECQNTCYQPIQCLKTPSSSHCSWWRYYGLQGGGQLHLFGEETLCFSLNKYMETEKGKVEWFIDLFQFIQCITKRFFMKEQQCVLIFLFFPWICFYSYQKIFFYRVLQMY